MIITIVIMEVRKRFILISTGPIRGFISLPCQKLYITLLVDPCMFRLATGALLPFTNNNNDKIVPRIQPLIENCTEFCITRSVTSSPLYIHAANMITDKRLHKKPKRSMQNNNFIHIIFL